MPDRIIVVTATWREPDYEKLRGVMDGYVEALDGVRVTIGGGTLQRMLTSLGAERRYA